MKILHLYFWKKKHKYYPSGGAIYRKSEVKAWSRKRNGKKIGKKMKSNGKRTGKKTKKTGRKRSDK